MPNKPSTKPSAAHLAKARILIVDDHPIVREGLVGLLNLNACLSKMGVKYSTIWSKDFSDEFFILASAFFH